MPDEHAGHNHREYKDPLACPCGCGNNKGGGMGLMLVGVALVVALLIVFMATQRGESAPEEEIASGPSFRAVELARGAHVGIPVADAFDVTEPFALQAEGPDGAAGPFLYVGPEKWNDSWKEKVDSGQVKAEDFAKGRPEAEYPGFARLRFTVDKAAEYEVWLRAYWVDSCGDSMAVAVDDRPLVTAIDSNHGRWVWTPLKTGENRRIAYRLEPGEHVLLLANREDDCYVARALLREAAKPAAPPPTEHD